MAFDATGYRKAARQAGIPTQVIEQTIADKTGTAGWLTGGKEGFGGVMTGVGNVLNLPSYALGGVMNRLQQFGGSKYGQGERKGFGIAEGVKNKRAIMSELPESFGVDPNSTAGKVMGFAGELLVPAPPVGKIARGFKGVDAASDAGLLARTAQKGGQAFRGAASDLSVGALRLPESSINAIEDAFKMPVDEVIRQYGFYGDKANVLPQIGAKLDELSKVRKGVRGSETMVNAKDFSNALREQAKQYKATGIPEAVALGEDLTARAGLWDKTFKGKVPFSAIDDYRKSGFEGMTQSASGRVMLPQGKQQAARTSLDVLEKYSPGYRKLGMEQRNLIELQKRVKSAPTGRGNLKFTSFKPSFTGGAAGFAAGSVLGNPFLGMAVGAGGTALASNPKFLSSASRASRGVSNFLSKPSTTKGLNAIEKAANRGIYTGLRTQAMPRQTSPAQRKVPQLGGPQIQLPSTNNIPQTDIRLFSDKNKRGLR